MKILILSPLPPPAGGIASWTRRYIAYCEDHDVELSCVNTAVIGKRAELITADPNLLSEIKRTVRIIVSLVRSLQRNKPEIVHLNTNCSRLGIFRDALCALIARRQCKALVLHCRCNIEDQLKGNKLSLSVFRSIAKTADTVLTLNSPSFHFVESYFPGKAKIIPNFVEESEVASSKKIMPTISRVAFVGHVQRTKGVFEIIELAKRYPSIEFGLVGPVSEEVKCRQIPVNCVLLGELSHSSVIDYLDRSDVFLFPSYTEGFANALLEAMARGLPAIASDVGANHDMLQDSGGIVVSSNQLDRLDEALELMMNPILRRNMSEWNIMKVANSYVVGQVMNELLCTYESLLALKSGLADEARQFKDE